MVTFVGTQTEFAEAIFDLIELDYDAIEAYSVAIENIEKQEYKDKLMEFKNDHQRHIKELNEVLASKNKPVPEGPSTAKQWLVKGKVYLANLAGDNTILRAMRSNEIDTNVAYERMQDREDQWDEVRDILKRGLEDERRHKSWLEAVIEQ